MAGNPRQAAYRVLMRCRRSGAWSEDAISSEIQKTSLSGRDGALCSRIVLGVLQNRTWLDFIIGTYCATPTEKLDPRVLDILRLSAYQILFLDKIPVSAAVNEGVSLCRREVNPGAAKLVNAVLRRIGEHREQLPEVPGKGTAAYLATRYSHPLWLAEELAAEHGYAFAEAALAANNEQPPVYAHANPLPSGNGPADGSGGFRRGTNGPARLRVPADHGGHHRDGGIPQRRVLHSGRRRPHGGSGGRSEARYDRAGCLRRPRRKKRGQRHGHGKPGLGHLLRHP